MSDILTLTMNPALDIATAIDRVEPVHKLRCGEHQTHPGGGGINVARVLHRLGSQVTAIYTAGGPLGRELSTLLDAEGVPAQVVPIAGETRESFTVHELSSGHDFRFVLPGPTLSEPEWLACMDAVVAGLAQARYVVVSGGLPPGVPADFYARLAQRVREVGGWLVLDSNGAALAETLAAGVYLVKPSLRELRQLTGLPLFGRGLVARCCTPADCAGAGPDRGAVFGRRGGLVGHSRSGLARPQLEGACGQHGGSR